MMTIIMVIITIIVRMMKIKKVMILQSKKL